MSSAPATTSDELDSAMDLTVRPTRPLQARFVKQVWSNDRLISLPSRASEDRWIISEGHLDQIGLALPHGAGLKWEDLYLPSDTSDLVKHDPAAPTWVRDWDGVFSIHVTPIALSDTEENTP